VKSYVMVSLSLEITRDADIIALLERLKGTRSTTRYVKQAIREKIAKEEKEATGNED